MPLAFFLLVAVAGSAYAEQPSAQPPEVRVLRLEGHLGPRKGGAPAATLVLDVDGEKYDFQVEHADVLKGSVLAADVLAEVSAYRPSFRLHGPDAELQKLRTATPESTVTITGYQRSGSRDFFVSEIVVGPGN